MVVKITVVLGSDYNLTCIKAQIKDRNFGPFFGWSRFFSTEKIDLANETDRLSTVLFVQYSY